MAGEIGAVGRFNVISFDFVQWTEIRATEAYENTILFHVVNAEILLLLFTKRWPEKGFLKLRSTARLFQGVWICSNVPVNFISPVHWRVKFVIRGHRWTGDRLKSLSVNFFFSNTFICWGISAVPYSRRNIRVCFEGTNAFSQEVGDTAGGVILSHRNCTWKDYKIGNSTV